MTINIKETAKKCVKPKIGDIFRLIGGTGELLMRIEDDHYSSDLVFQCTSIRTGELYHGSAGDFEIAQSIDVTF